MKTCSPSYVRFFVLSLTATWIFAGAQPSRSQTTWPPAFPPLHGTGVETFNPSTNTFTTPDGNQWVVTWYTTISAADGYTGGSNPPTTSLDAYEYVSYDFHSAYIGNPGSPGYKDVTQFLAYTTAIYTFPAMYNNNIIIDGGGKKTSAYDSTGLQRIVQVGTYPSYMVNGSSTVYTNNAPNTNGVVDFVYKITGNAGANVTISVATGYYTYTTATLGTATGSSITVLSQPYAGSTISKTYTANGTDGSTSSYTRISPDSTISFTMPAGGVYYFVVPASAQANVSISAGAIGYGTALTLLGGAQTGYGVVPYSISD